MATNIGVKIGVDGAAQFKSNLRSIDTELKSLSSEMKAATAQFQGNERSQEAVTKKSEILARTLETAEKKVALLSKEYEDQSAKLDELASALETAVKENGAGSDEAEKAQKAYNNQKDAVNKLGSQLHNAEADMYNVRNAEKAVGTEAESTTKKASSFGDTLKAVLTADFIKSGLSTIAEGLKKVGQAVWDTAKETAEYADEVQTLAVQYNLTTDEVQEYMYMQELADVSVETIAGSLTKLTKNMGEAKDGTGNAAEAFDKLGISVTDSNGELRSSQEVFKDAIDALGQIENATERDTVSMALFGKGAQDLNPLIALGAEGFADLASEAHSAGAVMSGDALQAAGEFGDTLERAKERTDALKRQIGEKLIPVFGDLLEKVLEWADGVDWDKVGSTISRAFEVVSGAVTLLIEDIKSVISWIQTAIADAQALIEKIRGITNASGESARDHYMWAAPETSAPTPGDRATPPRQSIPNAPSAADDILSGYVHSIDRPFYALDGMSASNNNARVVINTQSLSKSDIDYVVATVNSKLGAYA